MFTIAAGIILGFVGIILLLLVAAFVIRAIPHIILTKKHAFLIASSITIVCFTLVSVSTAHNKPVQPPPLTFIGPPIPIQDDTSNPQLPPVARPLQSAVSLASQETPEQHAARLKFIKLFGVSPAVTKSHEQVLQQAAAEQRFDLSNCIADKSLRKPLTRIHQEPQGNQIGFDGFQWVDVKSGCPYLQSDMARPAERNEADKHQSNIWSKQ